jgi:hypothetical protein
MIPLSGLKPVASACAVAAAIAVALAFAVIPADADPTLPPPPSSDQAIAANSVAFVAAPKITATATMQPDRKIQIGPSPTPRQIRRPLLSPTAAPTQTPIPPTATPDGPILSDVQLVANRGFESPGSWYLEQGASIATGNAHRGDGYLLLGSTGGYADQRFAVQPGVTYRVAMYVHVSAPATTRARIGVRYEDGAYTAVGLLDPIVVAVDEIGWQKVVFTFTAPDSAANALLTFWNPFGGASFAVDDVSIRPYLPE